MENNESENMKDVKTTRSTNKDNDRLKKIKNTDFSIAIIILFYGWIALSGAKSAIELIMGIAYNQVGFSLLGFIGTIINIVGIILILKRKMSGFILIVAITFLLPVVTSGLGVDIATTIILGLIRLTIISLVLLIRNDGVSGWAILTATNSIEESNQDTAPTDNVATDGTEQSVVEEKVENTKELYKEIIADLKQQNKRHEL